MAEVQNGSGAEEKASTVAFTAVKPWLVVDAPKASDAVQFYKTAFGAEELSRLMNPKRKADHEIPLVLSAELRIGSAIIVVSDLIDDSSATVKSAVTGGVICLETEDIEAALAQAVDAGATTEGEISEGEDACCRGRVGKVKDPYGNIWLICSPSKKCADVEA
ncbi:uncharacterized protein At5g48480-like [Olea europaea var. sylvestris]|uniref:uncharacterized protein At5g48480-like n=1 Tax=Olea europaea var. sylvestris TaxID=158386 RepID=UPI000C1CEE07|nr:uncharacterized protein At5g48480-like [Olea europaea var. sylvestris]